MRIRIRENFDGLVVQSLLSDDVWWDVTPPAGIDVMTWLDMVVGPQSRETIWYEYSEWKEGHARIRDAADVYSVQLPGVLVGAEGGDSPAPLHPQEGLRVEGTGKNNEDGKEDTHSKMDGPVEKMSDIVIESLKATLSDQQKYYQELDEMRSSRQKEIDILRAELFDVGGICKIMVDTIQKMEKEFPHGQEND